MELVCVGNVNTMCPRVVQRKLEFIKALAPLLYLWAILYEVEQVVAMVNP